MAKFFEKALSRIDANPLESVPTTLEFEHFDVGKLAKRLNLESNGKNRGLENQPTEVSVSLDSIESTIVAEIETYRKNALDRASVAVEAYAARIGAFDFSQIRAEVVASISAANANLITEVHQGENELFQKKTSLVDSASPHL